MNNLLPFIAIAIYVMGLASGVVIFHFGFKLGFKASFETRLLEDDIPDSKRLFPDTKEPAEFQLLEKEQEDDES